MRISEKGLRLLMQWEGFRPSAYDDGAGYPTIGVGHKLRPEEAQAGAVNIGGQAVPYAGGITEPQAEALLRQDLAMVEAAVNSQVAKALSQNQFDALVSLAFNVGVGAFSRSTLLRLINAGRLDAVPNEFMRWVYAGQKKVPGLVRRREMEVALWEGKL
jgi:lysozyme